ncbi:MAG: MASE1 domain-containing protein, partial [Melioribacteraceae bacterium]|nr:MASE1 domain-containing protein [Melioribacteraceae bacterium]
MNLIESTYKNLSKSKTILIFSEILIVIIIYLSTIIPSNESIIDKIITSPIWIPSGIFLSAVILLGNRKLISIFLGALIILFLILIYSTDVYGIGNSIIIAILIAIGETFEIYMAAYYYRKKIKTKTFINNSSLFIKFFILTIFISIIGATIGTVIIFIWHVNSELNYPIIWLNWAMSHILSYMLLTPLILNWRYKSFVVWNKQRFLEASILLVVMIALTQIIFGELYPNSVIFAFPYLVIPLVLWVVIKFSYREIIFILV